MSDLEIWTDSIETGQWCDKCQLSSAITAHARTVGEDGVGAGGITFTFCPDCQERDHQWKADDE